MPIADIFVTRGVHRSFILGQTVLGKNWLIQNMIGGLSKDMIGVQTEGLEEIIDLMVQDGLNVEVK